MQPFQIVYSYYKTIPAVQIHAQTWCRTANAARERLKNVLPAGGHLLEAWMVEWRKKDAAMEQLSGHTKQPHAELVRMVERARGQLRVKGGSKTRNTIIDIPKEKPPSKQPYAPFIVYYACSVRDLYLSNKG